jgi:hypothetical protein
MVVKKLITAEKPNPFFIGRVFLCKKRGIPLKKIYTRYKVMLLDILDKTQQYAILVTFIINSRNK